MEENKINYLKLQKKLKKNLPVYQKTESYNFRYAKFAEITDEQMVNNHWTWKEIDVEKDKQDFMVLMTPTEKFATTFFLKIFLKYELVIGSEYWSDRFMKMFKRPEFQRKAAWNCHQELNVHAPFYNELNKQLGLNTDEFYESFKQDPELVARVNFIGEKLNHKLDLISLATFVFLEGSSLYSLFAYFKHYQIFGKNMLGNVVRGTDMSVLDENNHANDGANAFKIVVKEGFEAKILNDFNYNLILTEIYALTDIIYEHECLIIDKGFSKGAIQGVTKYEIKQFVLLRINECLMMLGLTPKYRVTDTTVFQWFKDTTTLYTSNDTFIGKGREYKTGFNKSKVKYIEGLV